MKQKQVKIMSVHLFLHRARVPSVIVVSLARNAVNAFPSLSQRDSFAPQNRLFSVTNAVLISLPYALFSVLFLFFSVCSTRHCESRVDFYLGRQCLSLASHTLLRRRGSDLQPGEPYDPATAAQCRAFFVFFASSTLRSLFLKDACARRVFVSSARA